MILLTDGDGAAIEISPVLEAMIEVLLLGEDKICQNNEGTVELHYVRPRTERGRAKVDGKIKSHMGLAQIRGEPAALASLE